MHGKGWSVIVPDQLYFEHNGNWRWIQPLGFGANICANSDVDSDCRLRIDISARQSLRVRFMGTPPLCAFEDGSHLYECEIFGPLGLLDHTTGDARFDEHSRCTMHHCGAYAQIQTDRFRGGGSFRDSSLCHSACCPLP